MSTAKSRADRERRLPGRHLRRLLRRRRTCGAAEWHARAAQVDGARTDRLRWRELLAMADRTAFRRIARERRRRYRDQRQRAGPTCADRAATPHPSRPAWRGFVGRNLGKIQAVGPISQQLWAIGHPTPYGSSNIEPAALRPSRSRCALGGVLERIGAADFDLKRACSHQIEQFGGRRRAWSRHRAYSSKRPAGRW